MIKPFNLGRRTCGVDMVAGATVTATRTAATAGTRVMSEENRPQQPLPVQPEDEGASGGILGEPSESTMTAPLTPPSTRVLTCAFNRRRSRVSPHFETDGNFLMMDTQSSTLKPKLPSMKPPRGDTSKSLYENFQESTDKRSCEDSANE